MTFREWYKQRYGIDPVMIERAEQDMEAAWDAGYTEATQMLARVFKKLYAPEELKMIVADLESRANPLEHLLKALREE